MSSLIKLYEMFEQDGCPDGYRWCKIQKKCVPAEEKGQGKGLGRGNAEGPMGKPFKNQSEMFAADIPGFKIKKMSKIVDILVDSSITECPESEPNFLKNDPDDSPEELLRRLHGDIAGYNDPEVERNEYQTDDDEDDSIETYDNHVNQLESIFREQDEDRYHSFFRNMMDEEGITSIDALSTDEKSDFFKKVAARWKEENGESIAESFKYF